jgi:hypothetical protein
MDFELLLDFFDDGLLLDFDLGIFYIYKRILLNYTI